MQRRKFIKRSFQASALFCASQFPTTAFAKGQKQLCILHTNDVHSHLDPFPMDGGKYEGLGGVKAREHLIKEKRLQKNNVLLLDAGDMFQGTPYYNLFKGEAEIKMMNLLGYDAGTIGNHDFDNGIDQLAKMLGMADFPLINCNYNFANTPLEQKVPPYKIFRQDGLKIGVLGVGIALEGLVLKSLYGNTQYKDPIVCANKMAAWLKEKKKCDYIICLSHLGYKYESNKISDVILARESEHINLIIGGHTHTFLKKPTELLNKKNKVVLINQVGWAGINMGEININFNHTSNIKHSSFTLVINSK